MLHYRSCARIFAPLRPPFCVAHEAAELGPRVDEGKEGADVGPSVADPDLTDELTGSEAVQPLWPRLSARRLE